MASKYGMAGGIPERRVRPIWDAIESRQFKNALKHSQALLSKHPSSPYALALKALILERMGKSEEALSVGLGATEQLDMHNLYDDLTLSTLQVVFQRLDRLDLATSCYEHACAKFPNNLELMMGLFNCYVREYSFVKQQQAAIKMYKIVNEERFLLWAVCSIQLQVFCGDGGEKLLLLAEGLLKKHIASHSLHEPEALLVYISVLEQQAKYRDAFDVLSGELGSLLMIEVDKLRMQGRLLARAGDYSAATSIFQKILELCPDDWECFLHYLSCLLEDESCLFIWANGDQVCPSKGAGYKNSHLADDVLGSRLSDASAFAEKLKSKACDEFVRCPYLAILEIERRKCILGEGDEDKIMEALIEYFSRFGHLACFTSDVEEFLQMLPINKSMGFLENVSKDSLPMEPIKMLGKSITIFKLHELIGVTFKLPASDLVVSGVEMAKMFCKGLPLSKDLDAQETMHGEELLSMVCNVLVQLYWRTRNLAYLLEAIIVLEFGLTVRRYVSQYKILLLHLYSFLGASSLAYEWYKSLDVKNILLETVSHQIVPQLLVSPLWADLSDTLNEYLKFMDDHFRESADLTFVAYRHRNYSKVIEFVQFKERLQRSNQYLMARVEAPILQLKRTADNLDGTESVLRNLGCGTNFFELSNEIGSKSLTFNEDLQTRPWWTPSSDRNYLLEPFEGVGYRPKENMQQLVKEREVNVRKIIEKRSLLPRLLYVSIGSATASVKDNVEVNGSISDPKILTELKILLDRYAGFLELPFHDAIEVLIGVSKGQKSLKVLDSKMNEWLNFAVFWNAWNSGRHYLGQTENMADSWHIVDSLLRKCVQQNIRSMELLPSYSGLKLPILVELITEPLAWHSLIIQSCIRSSIPTGKKKKRSGHTDHSTCPLSAGARISIESVCGTIEEVINWLRSLVNMPEEENMDSLLSCLQSKGESEGPGQVLQVLEALISSVNEVELGPRVTHALKIWSPVEVARKIVSGQKRVFREFLQICESKLKTLQALKQQIPPVQT